MKETKNHNQRAVKIQQRCAKVYKLAQAAFKSRRFEQFDHYSREYNKLTSMLNRINAETGRE